MITIKNQNFGVEIEMTGITRTEAATVIANYFGSRVTFEGGYYDTHTATDTKGRTWKCMYDGSIHCQVVRDGDRVFANKSYSCEVVTPILQYDDIEDLQAIIRLLVNAGAIINSSCGIHIHIDGANHSGESLSRLLNFAVGRQDLFYEALKVGDRKDRWCKPISSTLLNKIKNSSKTINETESIWYSRANDDYRMGINHEHYNPTRYHGINLHAFFTKGTVEFRLFNGTLHAGKIKAYIQFCLAMSAWAINAKDNLYFKSCAGYTQEQKKNLMLRVLKNRLGLKGAEFETCRYHLTKAFETSEISEAA